MGRATLLAVAVVSAAVLAYQVLLLRLFSIVGWPHFASMIISVALLGFGASGTALTLARGWLLRRFRPAFAAACVLFAATAVGSFAGVARLPFNPLALVWDPRQLVWLGASYALLVLPFFFGGGAIGLAFARAPERIGRTYAFDLVGAGIGALGVVGLLHWLAPGGALRLVAALGLAAAALACLDARRAPAAALAGAAVLAALWLPPGLTALRPHVSPYKGLPLALQAPDARVVAERSGPLGLLTVVESPRIPFRHAPGLSLNNLQEPPPQLGLFTDADGLSAITRFTGDLESLGYLDFTTAALPYHLVAAPRVLILGAGGGEQVLLALYHRAPAIDAVDLDTGVIDLVARDFADFAGGIYAHPAVEAHVGEARGFVARTDEAFDLIQVPLLGSSGAAAAGTQSLHESYAFTVEAMGAYLDRLAPGGLLAVTFWLKLPPRDAPKLIATAVAALRERGVADPGARLALIRSWRTSTLLVRNGDLTADDVVAVRNFAAARSFDVDWLPGLAPEEANRFNVLDRPYLYEAAAALTGEGAEAYVRDYKFNIAPATDDQPYFHDFFRWRFLPELLRLGPGGAAALLDMGYLILVATLAQAVALSLLLILLPLAVRRRRFGGPAPKARVSGYFLALGLAFLFVEIAFIQRFTLFLGHPIYAVAVVLAGFLAFAGLGSALSGTLDRALAGRPDALGFAAIGIALVAVTYLVLLGPLFEAFITLPVGAKIVITLALIAPLACLMGMPFPLGLARVARENEDLVPWAWGINGCASVMASILATLLAIHLGFAAVVGIAVALYLAAPLVLSGGPPGPRRAASGRRHLPDDPPAGRR